MLLKRDRFRIAIDSVMFVGFTSGALWEFAEALRGASFGPPFMGALIAAGFAIDLWRALHPR